MRRVLHVVLGLAGAYLVVVALLFAFQRALLFPRDPTRMAVAAAGLTGFEEIALPTADGETLVAWSRPPAVGRPVMLYLPGNGGTLANPGRVSRLRGWADAGLGVVAIHWRGYGGSTGSPSEAGLHADAAAGFARAAALAGSAGPGGVVVYGESLGTGPAVRLGVDNAPRAVILEAPYLSTLAVAQALYPFVPVAALMRDPLRSDLIVERLRAPLLVLHGERDTVIPVAQGRALFELAPPPKRLELYPLGGHEDLAAHGAREAAARFLADVEAGRLLGVERRRGPGGRWPEPDLGN